MAGGTPRGASFGDVDVGDIESRPRWLRCATSSNEWRGQHQDAGSQRCGKLLHELKFALDLGGCHLRCPTVRCRRVETALSRLETALSEEDRSRLYAWLREQTDEPLAEYVMSCLTPAPLPDLVTKQHLETVLAAEFSAFALTMAAQREADREAAAAQREADRTEMAEQRDADQKTAAVQREADRTALDRRLRRISVALPIEIVVALSAVVAITEWLRG